MKDPIQRWLISCLLFFVSACTSPEATNSNTKAGTIDSLASHARYQNAAVQLLALQPVLQTGDLVLRTGNDFTSELLRGLNQRDETYSHCGIASIENDSLFVYHAVGGEFNPDQHILRESLLTFANGLENRGVGLYRYNISAGDKAKLVQQVQAYYRQPVLFDMNFDLATDDRMYCAELVYKSLQAAVGAAVHIRTSQIEERSYIGVDDLFLSPECALVKRISYK